MLVSYICMFTAFVFILRFYFQRKRAQRIFTDMGIPGPIPNFLFGNLLFLWGKKGFHDAYQMWAKTYGSIFGYFEGPSPVLVTSDPDIIQDVFIKQFHNFHARKAWPVQADPETDEKIHMFFAMGDRWKRLRSIVSPAFSSRKMRQMSPEIGKTINGVMKNIKESKGKAMDFFSLFQRLTLDTIVHCAFGVNSDAASDETEPFLTHCRGVINDTTNQPLLYICGFILPTLKSLWMAIYNALHYIKFNPVFWLEDQLEVIIKERKKEIQPLQSDVIQLLIDARMENISHHEDSKNTTSLNTLSNQEIIQQGLLFLLAGYETTSTTLAYIFHELASNQDVQEKLRMEIQEHYPTENDIPTYDNVRYLKYLDMVVKETLRKYPLASVVIARKCTQTCVVKGITIPKGMVIQANVWSLHRDSELWNDDELELFKPERFSEENSKGRHPYAWLPFGAGPRMCAGLRFAMLETKMATITMIRKFIFKPAADHKLEMIEGATVIPKHGVRLHAVPA